MRKTLTSIAAAAAIATGPLMASGLYAQESGRQEMPGSMMGEGMMGQGMMPMMQQMSQMMQTCNNMMQAQGPPGPARPEDPVQKGPEDFAPQPENQG